jgi:hypothetical protein
MSSFSVENFTVLTFILAHPGIVNLKGEGKSMISIRNINPMVRAVATMGAIAALVGGVTFANLSSNTAALSTNTLSSSTAALVIGAGTNCPGDTPQTSISGLTATLTPGVPTTPFAFCLDNTGNIPLSITAQIPTNLTSSPIPATDVTLTLTCPNIGTLSGTLDQYANPASFPGAQLATTTPEDCTATATLNASYTGSGNQAVTPFDIDFVGNQ